VYAEAINLTLAATRPSAVHGGPALVAVPAAY
jgi:hypothetical protein